MDRADRQKLILIVLVTVVIGYVGYAGIGTFPGVSGFRAEAAKLEHERNDLAQQVQDAQTVLANLDRIKKEREALEAQLKEITRRLPSEHESAQVLRSVETLASRSGLTVTQVRRRPSRPQELYMEIPMEVGVTGLYHDLLKFADQLSQLPRLVTLNEVGVQNRAPASTPSAPTASGPAAAIAEVPGTMRAQMVAVVFQALPEAARGATPAGATPPARP